MKGFCIADRSANIRETRLLVSYLALRETAQNKMDTPISYRRLRGVKVSFPIIKKVLEAERYVYYSKTQDERTLIVFWRRDTPKTIGYASDPELFCLNAKTIWQPDLSAAPTA